MNKNVWLLALCQALLMSGNIVLISVNGLIGQQLSPSDTWVTLPVSTQFVGLMMATIPASLIMAKIGRKNGFRLGNIIGILGALLCVYALNQGAFWLFCFSTLLLGVGIGFGTLYRFAAIEVSEPEVRDKAISLSMAGGVLAATLGPNLAIASQHWLPGTHFSGAFVGIAALYIISLLVLHFIALPPAVASRDQSVQSPVGQILKAPGYLVAVIAAVVAYAVMNLLMTVTPIAMHKHGFHFEQAALVIEWHVLGMFIPSFFTGTIIGKIGARMTILLGSLFFVGCILVNLNGVSEWHFRAALVMLGVGWNFMFIGATSQLTQTYLPQDKARAQAMNEFAVFGSVTVTALAAGFLEASLGWQTLNLIVLPFVCAVPLIYLLVTRTPKKIVA
ncbi:MFS transporter [Grimontia hollisae]|uniref:Multidrug efflux system protein MdtL n=2 Tax=Grimontia hollisae TaxID=673 RepID=A0A377J7M6_GRIHO|nr:MFS transporter [Grimontia hollisae]AMG29434.1 MFS transporter [Grimontia hollisae]EEY71995.1 putative drug transport transmembrane protein [Grimontia hollisae CIP 101886]STO77496.1 multidrug efflux system protein MdtL [Grimontia hollisae]STO98502.1 multidrug efflux system protein MdtL [Grimontia hollisae]STQ75670.1 multidrug efflux system protein MdtL [Grimontia hollisae]